MIVIWSCSLLPIKDARDSDLIITWAVVVPVRKSKLLCCFEIVELFFLGELL